MPQNSLNEPRNNILHYHHLPNARIGGYGAGGSKEMRGNMKPREKTEPNSGAFGYEGPDIWSKGLTKREYFAAVAMQGLLSSETKASQEEFSKYSVMCADSLIRALNEENPTDEQPNII